MGACRTVCLPCTHLANLQHFSASDFILNQPCRPATLPGQRFLEIICRPQPEDPPEKTNQLILIDAQSLPRVSPLHLAPTQQNTCGNFTNCISQMTEECECVMTLQVPGTLAQAMLAPGLQLRQSDKLWKIMSDKWQPHLIIIQETLAVSQLLCITCMSCSAIHSMSVDNKWATWLVERTLVTESGRVCFLVWSVVNWARHNSQAIIYDRRNIYTYHFCLTFQGQLSLGPFLSKIVHPACRLIPILHLEIQTKSDIKQFNWYLH